jgi:hypothetical protein
VIDCKLTSEKKEVKTRSQQNNCNEALASELKKAHDEAPAPNSLIDRKALQNGMMTVPDVNHKHLAFILLPTTYDVHRHILIQPNVDACNVAAETWLDLSTDHVRGNYGSAEKQMRR